MKRIVLLLAALAASQSALADNALGAAEIKVLVTGNTVYLERLSDGERFRNYFADSGDVILQRPDAMEFTGRWSVRGDGSHCVFFAEESCGKITKNADGTYTRIARGIAFRWLKITPGKDF